MLLSVSVDGEMHLLFRLSSGNPRRFSWGSAKCLRPPLLLLLLCRWRERVKRLQIHSLKVKLAP